MGESLVIVALLLACLIALLLILIARRDANEVRRRSAEEAAEARQDIQRQIADADARLARVAEREVELAQRETELTQRQGEIAQRLESELERVSQYSIAQAREELAQRLLADAELKNRAAIRKAERVAKREAEERAQEILTTTIQRLAVPTSAQSIVTLVQLPSEEMKGRIIGKEGRNIRTFETITGVNVVIDETPTTVLLSCFDPERREIARDMLESLIADGRIHPERIESAHIEAMERAQQRTIEAGQRAADEVGVGGLAPELIRVLGRLRLRTSFGQNVLDHMIESAHLAALIAAELGLHVELARRAAFLHDIGKALSHEVEGTHALLGADLARRHGESQPVVNAIAAHHDEVPSESMEAVVVQIADAISAARPGARREELDQYVERVDRLEKIASQFPGVERAFAMNAGREVRIAVSPNEVDDQNASELANQIAQRIEEEMTYPGQIKIVVIREMRATATAS
ncbi:MAG TPA: ribonuclease Y [Actinomycetales bacterium]|nr:ribonuclease Y [Actinomycetales bacterium]